MGSKTLFIAVFIRPEQVVHFFAVYSPYRNDLSVKCVLGVTNFLSGPVLTCATITILRIACSMGDDFVALHWIIRSFPKGQRVLTSSSNQYMLVKNSRPEKVKKIHGLYLGMGSFTA